MARVDGEPLYSNRVWIKTQVVSGLSLLGNYEDALKKMERGTNVAEKAFKGQDISEEVSTYMQKDLVTGNEDVRSEARFVHVSMTGTYNDYEFLYDGQSTMILFYRLVSGLIESSDIKGDLKVCKRLWSLAKDTTFAGCVASLMNAPASNDAVESSVSPYKLGLANPCEFNAFYNAEAWKKGTSTSTPAFMKKNHPNAERQISWHEVKGGGVLRCWDGLQVFSAGEIRWVVDTSNRTVYVTSQTHLNQMSENLPRVFLSRLVAHNHNMCSVVSDDLKHKGSMYDKYINAYIDVAKKKVGNSDHMGLSKAGKSVKTAYSARMALFEHATTSGESAEVMEECSSILQEEAVNTDADIGPIMAVLFSWDDDDAANFGTVWNIHPQTDIDAVGAFNTAKEQWTSEKKIDEDKMAKFLEWSRGLLTSRVVSDNPDGSWEWVGISTDEEELWKKTLLEGQFVNRPDGSSAYARKGLRWEDTISTAHYRAKSVTRIDASSSAYPKFPKQKPKVRDSWKADELLTVLHEGDLLSHSYTPAEVRKAMMSGNGTGDLVSKYSGKAENTKGGDIARDVHSGCDTYRKVFSEIDSNMGKIAGSIIGVLSRKSRGEVERVINSVISGTDDKNGLLSIDVKAWSPGMVRKLEMQFGDMCMDLFDVPDTFRVSKLFQTLHVFMRFPNANGDAYIDDGSVQGWFGCLDSIMHHFICHFVITNAPSMGTSGRKTKKAFVTLIDDVMARITRAPGGLRALLKDVVNGYAELGQTTELSKTLAGSTNGNMLNRCYARKKERITCNKIAAKVYRERERSLVTVWEDIDCIFNSMSGAIDRGYDPVAGHVIATWMALLRARESNKRVMRLGGDFALVGAWLPRCMGGWGMVTPLNMICYVASHDLERCFGNLHVIRQAIISDSIRSHCEGAIQAAIDGKIEPRSAVATASDPFGVSFADIPDPSNPKRRLMRRASSKHVIDEKMLRMFDSEPHLEVLLKEASQKLAWHPALFNILYEVSSTAAIEALLAKAEGNEAILLDIKKGDINSTKRGIAKIDKFAVVHFEKYFVESVEPRIRDSTVLQICVDMRARQSVASGIAFSRMDGFSFCGTVVKSDQPATATIGVFPNKISADDLYKGTSKSSIVRTKEVAAAVSVGGIGLDRSDPFVSAMSKTIVGKGYAMKIHGPIAADIVELVFIASWLGTCNVGRVSLPSVKFDSNNARRVSSACKRTAYTVAAWPNAGGLVSVDCNKAISIFDSTDCEIDWMMLVFGTKASTMLDIWVNPVGGNDRKCTVKHNAIQTRTAVRCDAKDCNFTVILAGVIDVTSAHSFINHITDLHKTLKVNKEAIVDDHNLFSHEVAETIEKLSIMTPLEYMRKVDIRLIMGTPVPGGRVVSSEKAIDDDILAARGAVSVRGALFASGKSVEMALFVDKYVKLISTMPTNVADAEKAAKRFVDAYTGAWTAIPEAEKSWRMKSAWGNLNCDGSRARGICRMSKAMDIDAPSGPALSIGYMQHVINKAKSNVEKSMDKDVALYYITKLAMTEARMNGLAANTTPEETWACMVMSAIAAIGPTGKVDREFCKYIEGRTSAIYNIEKVESITRLARNNKEKHVCNAIANAWGYFVEDEIADAARILHVTEQVDTQAQESEDSVTALAMSAFAVGASSANETVDAPDNSIVLDFPGGPDAMIDLPEDARREVEDTIAKYIEEYPGCDEEEIEGMRMTLAEAWREEERSAATNTRGRAGSDDVIDA